MRRFVSALAALLTLGTAIPVAADEGPVHLSFVHPRVPTVAIADARSLFDDVNATRLEHGLPPLAQDAKLSEIALALARQMAARHYFGHTDPAGITFEQRIRASGYPFRFAAENIAYDRDEAHAHQAFLHSPGHYANIVDPSPRRLGTAVVAVGEGEALFVEEFAD